MKLFFFKKMTLSRVELTGIENNFPCLGVFG